MKKQLLFSYLISSALFSFAQPTIQWQKSLGGSQGDGARSIEQTVDGGYIIAGTSRSNDGDITNNNGNYDYWVVKVDNLGAIQWQKSYGGTNEEYARFIQQTSDGGYIVAGFSQSNDGDVTGNHGGRDCWIVKLNNLGAIQWQKSFGGTLPDEANWIKQTPDGGYIFAGFSQSNDGDVTASAGFSDYWVVKLDNVGAIQWQKSFGGSTTDEARSIQQTTDGGYIIAGISQSNDGEVTGNHGGTDCWIVKINSLGTIQWQKSLGGTLGDYPYVIQQTTDGGYIFAGYALSNNGDVNGNHGLTDSWIVKLDNSGTIQWQKCLGGTKYDDAYSIKQTSDGGYIIAGTSTSNNGDVSGNNGLQDSWIVKLTTTGNIQWKRCLGGAADDAALSIQQTTDGGYIVAGWSESTNGDVSSNNGLWDYWIVKLSGTTVGITEKTSENTLNIYPNPTYGTFILETTTEGVFSIMNELGQQIQKINLNNTNLFSVTINNLSTGIYFIVGYTNNKMIRQKIVITN